MGFLILGLPRSRTAWLANFFTYGGLRCMHEGLNGCRSVDEYLSKFDGSVGDASTGLATFQYERWFPEGLRTIVIDRDVDRAVQYGKHTYDVDLSDEMSELAVRLEGIDALHVDFDDIDDSLQEMWEYITDTPYDKGRAELMVRLNVTENEPYAFDEAALRELMKDKYAYRI